MRILPFLLCVMLLCVVVLPAGAADTSYEDMLKKAQNLNVTVPQKGTAPLGSQESMTEMVDWLNACTDSMLTFVNDIMNVFGIGNMPYTQNLTKTLEEGAAISPARTGK